MGITPDQNTGLIAVSAEEAVRPTVVLDILPLLQMTEAKTHLGRQFHVLHRQIEAAVKSVAEVNRTGYREHYKGHASCRAKDLTA